MSSVFRIGALILAGLLILAAGVFLIGGKEFLFSRTYVVKSEFQNVAGLVDGAEVRVGGIREGTVKQIDLPKRPDGKVTVVFQLHSLTRGVLKKDSVASIRSEGLLGDKHVEISFGSENAQRLDNGDTIGSTPPLDISDLIQKTDQILDTTKDTMQNIDVTTGSLKNISAKVDRGQGTAGALINDKGMYQHATAGVEAFQDDMEALKHNFLLRGFFKKRGYEDDDELRKYAAAHLPRASPTQQFTYDVKGLFSKPETAKFKDPKILKQAGAYLEGSKFGLAVVAVSGGMTGDSDRDLIQTEAQAAAVREYIVKTFRVDDTHIKTLGLGKAKDPADTENVRILVYSSAPAAGSQAEKGH